MSKNVRHLTKKEEQDIKQKLIKARNHFDNELFKIEQIWAKLQQSDYDKRAKLIKSATEMSKLDQELKVWEKKINI